MQISFASVARGALLLCLLLGASRSSAQSEPSGDGFPAPAAATSPSESRSPDAPLSTGTWVAHGTLGLLPLGSTLAASRLRAERLWVTGAQTGVGMLVGYLPGQLLFLRAQESGPRWMELEVARFGAGLVLAPSLVALGTWATGEWLFHGSRDRSDALLGALGGAAVGTLLGLAVHGLLARLAAPGTKLEGLRQMIAVGLIGSSATMGYQWAGGGPRPR